MSQGMIDALYLIALCVIFGILISIIFDQFENQIASFVLKFMPKEKEHEDDY